VKIQDSADHIQYVLKKQKEIIRDKKTNKKESFNVRSGEYEYFDR